MLAERKATTKWIAIAASPTFLIAAFKKAKTSGSLERYSNLTKEKGFVLEKSRKWDQENINWER